MVSSGDVPTTLPGEFQVGDVVGGTYVIRGYLGRGAMGHVYHAYHAVLGTEYALKTLSGEKVSELDWKRFQVEAQAIASMSHPNIVSVYNLGLHGGILPFYVMDLLDGIDLSRKIRNDGPLDLMEAATVFMEVCAGISYAHKKGVVHRDIKPANIFLLKKPGASGETVKVFDFGVAKLTVSKNQELQSLTGVGDVVGSPSYMSPEQTAGERVDTRSDIYSVGCTLFEALTGTLPFRGRNPTETMLMHQTTPPPSLSKASGGKTFPNSIEYVVATALAKETANRYQTMDQMAIELASILEGGRRPVTVVTGGATVDTTRSAPGLFDSRSSDTHTVTVRAPIPMKLAASAMVASIFAVAGFAYWHFHAKPGDIKTTAVVSEKRSTPSQSATAAVTDSAADHNDGQQELSAFESIEDAIPNQLVTPALLEKTPFSSIVTENGKKIRKFNFPKDVVIGWLSSSHLDAPLKATGEIKFGVDEKLTFTPTDVVTRAPNCLKRFKVGDIYALKFIPKADTDQIFSVTTEIPEVKEISFRGCSGLTARSLETFKKFWYLTEVNASDSNIDGTLIGQCWVWKNLNRFLFSHGHSIKELLEGFTDAPNLRHLCLSYSPMGSEEFDALNELTQVTHLDLSGNRVNNEELSKLLTMNEMVELHLKDTGINSSAIPILKQFPALHVLYIKSSRLPEEEVKKFEAALPRVKIR